MSAVVPFEPHSAVTEADRLGAHITELHSYISAATCHFLDLIREFDEHQYWAEQGFYSCAHWLNFHCGIGKNAAREKIRVAHALAERPKIREAFAEGRLSYSKARAITRIADDTNEDYLLNLCKHGTAHHVEHVVAQYRRAEKFARPDFAMDQFASREVTWRYDDDGSIVIRAKLPPDRGEVVLKALEKAIDVTAVTSREGAAQRRADALADVAETYLGNSEHRERPRRYRGNVGAHRLRLFQGRRRSVRTRRTAIDRPQIEGRPCRDHACIEATGRWLPVPGVYECAARRCSSHHSLVAGRGNVAQ